MYIQGSPRQDLETCKSPQRDYSVCECVTLSCCCYFCSPLTAGKRWRSGEFPFVWTERNREMLAFTVRTHNVIVLLKASKVVVNLNHLSPAGKVGIKLSYTKTDGCRRSSSSSSSPQNCAAEQLQPRLPMLRKGHAICWKIDAAYCVYFTSVR